ncbi:MAG: molybdenum cofactor guanylyltransferase [Pseudomonadota bacterium]
MAGECNIPILILAGGSSERFGSNKALAELGGKPLVCHVIERLRPQTSGSIAINTRVPEEFAHIGLPTISDHTWTGHGPLAGIFAALDWAEREGAKQVVTTAVDLPILPSSLINRLVKAGAPSIAGSRARRHPVIGLWRCSQIDVLDQYLRSGRRSAHGWAEHCGASIAEFDTPEGVSDPFLNINTRKELEHFASKIA